MTESMMSHGSRAIIKELANSIGSAVRKSRIALGLTQEDAAERVGICVQHYARIERGVSLPSIGTFKRMVSELEMSADDALGTTKPTEKQ